MNNLIKILLPFCFFLYQETSLAADSVYRKYPRVVLVQLRSEHNRIEALTKARKYKEVEEVSKDAREVAARMRLDFHDNFDYCPVYYYMDTNAELVKNKQFDGILFNNDGTPAKNLLINSKSKDYAIIYYGYPLSQARMDRVLDDSSRYSYDPQTPYGIGLIILNDKFLQIGYVYKLGTEEVFMNKRKKRMYSYYSEHFEIEYSGLANSLNRRMKQKRLDRRGFINRK